MFYRLPVLFSASFYIALSLAQFLIGPLGGSILYSISRIMTDNITPFFFILILSCLFFYQNKLYFCTPKNKLTTIYFSLSLVVVYLIIKYVTMRFFIAILFSKIVAIGYHQHFPGNITVFAVQFISIPANIWLFLLIGVIFYFMAKYIRMFFQAPLINDSAPSDFNKYSHDNQLNNDVNAIEYKKLYAIIFSATFCCVINAILWNVYFNILLSLSEARQIVENHYAIIFGYVMISIIINYLFLYYVAQKCINKTYSWIPVSSLFTACAITFILFSIVAIIMCFMFIPFISISNSIVLFVLWFVASYALLYVITRFAIKRYFA